MPQPRSPAPPRLVYIVTRFDPVWRATARTITDGDGVAHLVRGLVEQGYSGARIGDELTQFTHEDPSRPLYSVDRVDGAPT